MVNWMYNSSLGQFLEMFYYAIDNSPKSQVIKDRVQIITEWLTKTVYRNINRGLFERDKTTFKLMMCFKILIKEGRITPADVGLFLKAGGGVDGATKQFNWLDQAQWLNLVALQNHKFNNEHTKFFNGLQERIGKNEPVWKNWIYDAAEPENIPVPDYEDKIHSDPNIGHFIHLCLVRSLREDRTVQASIQFIRETLGDYFVIPVNDQIQEFFNETQASVPVLFLLSPGADANGMIDEFARVKKQLPTGKVSMGEE